jgi:hypothetical protein
MQASALCSNVPAGASGVRSLYNNNDDMSNNNINNNNNTAPQNEEDNNNNNNNDGPIISNTDPEHPRPMQTGTLRLNPGISLAG